MTPEDRSAARRRVAEFMGWHDEEYENVWQGGVDRYWRLIDHEGCRMEVACCSPEEAWASHNIPDLWADSPEGAAWREAVEEKLEREHDVCISTRFSPDEGIWKSWFNSNFRYRPPIFELEDRTAARAVALHAAVVALEGERG